MEEHLRSSFHDCMGFRVTFYPQNERVSLRPSASLVVVALNLSARPVASNQVSSLCKMRLIPFVALLATATLTCAEPGSKGDGIFTHPGISPDGYIVGGQTAQKGKWPYLVALFSAPDVPGPGVRAVCSGMLIKPDWVLSAAHCFDQWAVTRGSLVYIGQSDLDAIPDGQVSAYSYVSKIVHPDFYSYELGNDLALAKLESPVNIQPILLDTSGDVRMEQQKKQAWAVGYGYLEENNNPARFLQEIQVPLAPICTCYQHANLIPESNDVASRQVCYHPKRRRSRVCYGDSGSPLMVRHGRKSPWVARGILSFGTGGCYTREPDFYTRISAYLGWIKQTVGGSLDSRGRKVAHDRVVSNRDWTTFPNGTEAHRWCQSKGFGSGIALQSSLGEQQQQHRNVVCFNKSIVSVLEVNASDLFLGYSASTSHRLIATEYAQKTSNCSMGYLNGDSSDNGRVLKVTCIRKSMDVFNTVVDVLDLTPDVHPDVAGTQLAQRLGFSVGLWTGVSSSVRREYSLIGSRTYTWAHTYKNVTDRYASVECEDVEER